TRPSALLTTLWATMRMSPGTTPSPAAREASMSPRSSPGATSGSAESGQSLTASRSYRSERHACGLDPARSDAAEHREVLGGVDIKRQRGYLVAYQRQAARTRLGRMGGQRIRAQARLQHARPAQQERVGAGAVARGHTHNPPSTRGMVDHRVEIA